MVTSEACFNFLGTQHSLEEQVERFWKLETCEQNSYMQWVIVEQLRFRDSRLR